MSRGKLTDKVLELAKEQLNVDDFTRTELRLLPYIQYTMMNGQRIEPAKINAEERGILFKWRERGWIEGGASGLAISKEFWDAMNEILWVSYVAHEEAA